MLLPAAKCRVSQQDFQNVNFAPNCDSLGVLATLVITPEAFLMYWLLARRMFKFNIENHCFE